MSHPESSTVESTSLGRQQKQSLRRSARISTSSTQPQQPETSSIPDPPAVQFPASSPRKRKRAQQQDSDLPVAGPSVSRRSVIAIIYDLSRLNWHARRLSASNPTQPSSKSLGKRRAVSPESLPLHQEHPTEAATSRNPKKRKVNNPKPVSSASYNLRKRQGAVESTDQVAPSSSSAPSASTSKGKGKMPGKKEKKTAANEAKARAAEAAESSAMAGRAEETAAGMLPPSGERAAKKRSRRSPKSSAGAASSGSAPAPGGSSNEVRMQVGEPIAGDEQEHQEVVLEYSDGDSQDESEEGEDVLPFGDQHPFPGDDDDDDDDDDEDMDDDEHELGREFADAAAAMMDGPGDADGGAAAGLFGSFAASLAGFGMVSGLNARLKNILNQLRDRSGDPDATQKLVALQELSEILSISTEDTLAGFFNVEAFVQELVNILSPHPSTAISVVDLHGEETGIEMMLLACRCLANLMEALPGTSHSVYHAGAVPVLCSKLVEIQYIDLAEQTLSVRLFTVSPLLHV